MVYQWKSAGEKYPVTAQVAGETIEEITKTLGKGYIEKEDLLEASREENAPLHKCFEWRDEVAAEKYRVYQAGDIISNIVVVTVKVGDKTTELKEPTRAFVSVSTAKAKGKFVSVESVMSNEDYRKQVLNNAAFELLTFKNKYQGYAELSKVFESITDFADSLK